MSQRKNRNREFWARNRERFARTDRLLRERIAYHDAKLREERPGWTPPRTTDEWIAHYERKWAAERGE